MKLLLSLPRCASDAMKISLLVLPKRSFDSLFLLRVLMGLIFEMCALKLVYQQYVQNVIMSSMRISWRYVWFFFYKLLASWRVMQILSQSLNIYLQAVRKLNEAKKLESSVHYTADFGKEWGIFAIVWYNQTSKELLDCSTILVFTIVVTYTCIVHPQESCKKQVLREHSPHGQLFCSTRNADALLDFFPL